MSNPTREKLTLTKEQALDIIGGDNKDFVEIQNEIVEHKRWSVVHEIVVKRKSDGKYFMDTYQTGATESQDEWPYEYADPDFTEVFPVTKTYIDYE